MYITNNTVVYKTDLGNQVVQHRERDNLAQPLRTLLIVIDGKAKVHHYKTLLDTYSGVGQYGSVKKMLKVLYKHGLVGFRNIQEDPMDDKPANKPGVLTRWRNSKQGEDHSIEPKYSKKVSIRVD